MIPIGRREQMLEAKEDFPSAEEGQKFPLRELFSEEDLETLEPQMYTTKINNVGH